jgi:hypothetical protein
MLKKDTKIGIAWGGGLTVLVAILGLIASGNPAPRWAVVVLGILEFLCFFRIAAWHGQLRTSGDNAVLRFSGSLLRIAFFATAIGVPIAFLCWFALPPVRRHILSEDEVKRFEKPLRIQSSNRDRIQLACPAAEESTCVYAAQFINVFKRTGWKLQSYDVQRVSLAIPYEGIRMFGYVKEYPAPDAAPEIGEWSSISPSMVTIYRAFASIGIETETGIRKDEEQDVLTLYFGSERADENVATQFTGTIKKMEEGARQWQSIKERYPTL